jgi:hypothetical protein
MQITRKKKLKKQYYVKQVMPRGVHMWERAKEGS